MMQRRSFLAGLGSMIAAPAVVHAGNLMPIRGRSLYRIPEYQLVELGYTIVYEFTVDGVSTITRKLAARSLTDGTVWYDPVSAFVSVYPGGYSGSASAPVGLQKGFLRHSGGQSSYAPFKEAGARISTKKG